MITRTSRDHIAERIKDVLRFDRFHSRHYIPASTPSIVPSIFCQPYCAPWKKPSSSGRNPACSIRKCTPLAVGVSVHVTTVFVPFTASSPEAFHVYESRLLGSTTSTSQSVTPFHCGMGFASVEPGQMSGGAVFSVYMPNPKGPVFMTLIEKAFGKDQTTRTWQTLEKVVAA
jgi:hypothetical protein